MIHDLIAWHSFSNVVVMREADQWLLDFCHAEADFLPYFAERPPAATDMRDVYVSGYRKPNRTLLVVANLSREDRSGTVTVSADTLGHAAQRVTYWVTKEALSMARSDLRVTVPRQGYRMLRVEP